MEELQLTSNCLLSCVGITQTLGTNLADYQIMFSHLWCYMYTFCIMSILAIQISLQVNETARQVASSPSSIIPVPYDQMKSQCEALMNGKQEKMSVLRSFKQQQADWRVTPEEKIINAVNTNQASFCKYMFRAIFLQVSNCDWQRLYISWQILHSAASVISSVKKEQEHNNFLSSESEQSFRLPPASPYDKFLKAAGCWIWSRISLHLINLIMLGMEVSIFSSISSFIK